MPEFEPAGTDRQGVDPANPTPLYYQIYLLYRQKIMSGSLRYGDKLPSEGELVDQHNVSRITAKRGMDELAKEGLVSRSRGRGTIVDYRFPASKYSGDFSGLMENLVAIGATTTVDVLSFDYVPAPSPVADALGIEHGTMVQKAERRRSREDKPFSHIITFLPEDVGRSFDRQDLSDQPIISLIEKSGHEIQEATQSVTAVLAEPVTAASLNVPQGAPLLKITRVVRDQTGRPVQYIEVLYRPDVYQLNMSLKRIAGAASDANMWLTDNTDTPD